MFLAEVVQLIMHRISLYLDVQYNKHYALLQTSSSTFVQFIINVLRTNCTADSVQSERPFCCPTNGVKSMEATRYNKAYTARNCKHSELEKLATSSLTSIMVCKFHTKFKPMELGTHHDFVIAASKLSSPPTSSWSSSPSSSAYRSSGRTYTSKRHSVDIDRERRANRRANRYNDVGNTLKSITRSASGSISHFVRRSAAGFAGVTLKCLSHKKSARGKIITELTCIPLVKYRRPYKKSPRYRIAPEKFPPAERAGRIFAGKLSAGGRLFWGGRLYNGTQAGPGR